MKLFEILDVKQINHPKNTAISPQDRSNRIEDEHFKMVDKFAYDRPKVNKSVLGAGLEAIVFNSNSPQRTGVATKWLRNQKTDAQNNSVIKYLTQSQQLNSTFAPKVYSIKQFKRPNGLYEYAIQMEKLHIDLDHYGQKYGDDSLLMDQLKSQVYIDNNTPDFKLKQTDVERIIFGLKNITPSSTKEVTRYIQFMKTIDNYLDIKSNNVMIRLTSVGPQLVITDPVIGIDS